MNIFPQITLTKAEEEELIIVFSTQVVRKYLQLLASTLASELALSSQNSIPSEEFCRKLAHHQGKLATLETLMQAASVNDIVDNVAELADVSSVS